MEVIRPRTPLQRAHPGGKMKEGAGSRTLFLHREKRRNILLHPSLLSKSPIIGATATDREQEEPHSRSLAPKSQGQHKKKRGDEKVPPTEGKRPAAQSGRERKKPGYPRPRTSRKRSPHPKRGRSPDRAFYKKPSGVFKILYRTGKGKPPGPGQ